MSNILIKDLTESIDLDREAMLAITGGSRSGARPSFPGRTIFRSNRIFSYPAGFASNPHAEAFRQAAGSKSIK